MMDAPNAPPRAQFTGSAPSILAQPATPDAAGLFPATMERDMRNHILKLSFAILPLLFAGAAAAQDTRGAFFVGPGGTTQSGFTQRSYEVGGSVERLLAMGIGAGAELEGVVHAAGQAKNSVGIFSLNPYYHFLKERALDPYATFGYSLLFRDYTANLYNYGGGVNYWFKPNMGVKVEVRDHVWSHPLVSSTHIWGVRVGITFR